MCPGRLGGTDPLGVDPVPVDAYRNASSGVVDETTACGGVLLLAVLGATFELEGLEGLLPLLPLLARRGVFLCFLAMVDKMTGKHNKIKERCCGTVNPINASSWKVFRRALMAL